jgi:hypothetical protein
MRMLSLLVLPVLVALLLSACGFFVRISPAPTAPMIIAPPTPTNILVPEPPPTPIPILLEDFESTMRMKWWSPDPHVFSYILTSEQAHGGIQSLRIEYRKSDTYQFIGAEPPSNPRDFSQTQILQVWVYGQVNLLLKLEDQDGQQADVATQNATDSSGWKLLRFNYTGVANRVNLNRIKNLFFFPAPGDRSASGVVYFDDIALSEQP